MTLTGINQNMKNIQHENRTDFDWLPVDNAANLYAGAREKHWCRTYRLSLQLDREIEKDKLQKALADTLKRLPTFAVKLGDGLFWSYLEKTDKVPDVLEESEYPYRPLTPEFEESMGIRVLFCRNKISLEGCHAVADGHGAIVFLCTLCCRYLELDGVDCGHNDFALDVSAEINEDELEDAYHRIADSGESRKSENKTDVYRYFPEDTSRDFVRVFHGITEAENLKAAARKHGITVSEYLAAMLIFAVIKAEEKAVTQPIIISIPVDLRHFFPSETVRNFAFAVPLEFNPEGRKNVSFDEIADAVRGRVRQQATAENMKAFVNGNVSSQEGSKLVPWPIKKAVLRGGYKKNQCSYTSVISNLGILNLPDGMKEHIEFGDVLAGATAWADFNCSLVTINGLVNFSMSSGSHKTALQKAFFTALREDGVTLTVCSNIKDGNGEENEWVKAELNQAYPVVQYPETMKRTAMEKRRISFFSRLMKAALPVQFLLQLCLIIAGGVSGKQILISASAVAATAFAAVFFLWGILSRDRLCKGSVRLIFSAVFAIVFFGIGMILSAETPALLCILAPVAGAVMLLILLCLKPRQCIAAIKAYFHTGAEIK